MAEPYDHTSIESKWQSAWDAANAFATPEIVAGDPKDYILDFFPYPSGSGLHVGHLLPYVATDIVARMSRKQGKKVLHPMGWDAFGLPAENFAIKSGVHPAISTVANIKEYKRQLRQAGTSYDWSKEISACDPNYYKWTQWLFTLLYERGLAYRKEGSVNWCPKDQTVLANEQVVGGRCDRCGTQVVQKNLRQWYFRITDYTERLLEGLDRIEWPEQIKTMQRNWIGKSQGVQLFFDVVGSSLKIEAFTTRADTLYGATYLVLAPEHALVAEIVTPEQSAAVKEYQEAAARKNELERTFLDKEKSGVFTGAFATNPATGQEIPIWIADYVLATYGTGAIMAVPAHDERDFEFATKFGLPVVEVIERGDSPLPYSFKGTLINSGGFSGMTSLEAVPGILEKVGGTAKTTYRLRDWLVSRQRFWGSPIPISYDDDGNEYLLPLDQLPVELPMDVEFQPNGKSPLALAAKWNTYVDPKTGKTMHREVDTLDTFVCSSWYFLRFPTPNLDTAAFDPQEVAKWLPVDLYVGGAEHAVLHLLYARFFTKVLFDAGLLPFDEPFRSLRNQGMILGPDHNKMSKSKGNVINPDEVIAEYGADTLRVYEQFMGPFEIEKPWNTKGILGARRFLEKVWRLQDRIADHSPSLEEERIIHRLIKKVGDDIANFRFNVGVAAMMESVNQLSDLPSLSKKGYLRLLHVLNPYAPHITEELWQKLGQTELLSNAPWPSYDESLTKLEEVEYPVQIDGKIRFRLNLAADLDAQGVLAAVRSHERYCEWTAGKSLVKEIVVPGRLVSLVTSPVDK